MYPFITRGNTTLYMTGLGIVVGFATFIITMLVLTKKYHLSFFRFFMSLPLCIILMYILGAYTHILIEYGIFFPSSPQELLFMISPYGYNFHYIGIILGLFLYLWVFLKKADNMDKKKRIDAFFYGITIAIIPLGLFLLLGDDFIGKATESNIAIHSLTEKSKLAKYNQVYPLGLFLSLASFLTLIIKELLDKKTRKKTGLLGLATLIFLISIVLLFQNYPKHGVMKLFSFTTDIKQYTSRLLVLILTFAYVRQQKKYK